MDHLKNSTNLRWTGYYLAPAPNHQDPSWMGKKYFLDLMGWGIAPIYVGQQDPLAPGNFTRILTNAQGNTDADDAVVLASGDGFPDGTVIFLDWEAGPPGFTNPKAKNYITAWVNEIIAKNFTPGIYCSHRNVSALKQMLGPQLSPQIVLWVWNLRPPYTTACGLSPAVCPVPCPFPSPDPSCSGVCCANAWQLIHCANITVCCRTLCRVDLDSAGTDNPSGTSTCCHSDTHSDVPCHSDLHDDHSDAHSDAHDDDLWTPHGDSHDDYVDHGDGYIDHGDHDDVVHDDKPHVDVSCHIDHDDVDHDDKPHVDVSCHDDHVDHCDTSHTDDCSHVDVDCGPCHQDYSDYSDHDDTQHDDECQCVQHDDEEHQDVCHIDQCQYVQHDDEEHQDTPPVDQCHQDGHDDMCNHQDAHDDHEDQPIFYDQSFQDAHFDQPHEDQPHEDQPIFEDAHFDQLISSVAKKRKKVS